MQQKAIQISIGIHIICQYVLVIVHTPNYTNFFNEMLFTSLDHFALYFIGVHMHWAGKLFISIASILIPLCVTRC